MHGGSGAPLLEGHTSPSTFDEFLQEWKTSADNYSIRIWYDMSFDEDGATDSGGNVTLWKYVEGKGHEKVGKATYERRTVHGTELLVINHRMNGDTSFPFLTVYDSKVVQGSLRKSGTKGESTVWVNQTMMNAILDAAKLPVVQD
jgi:hypothetical protein